jgi:hypothetical protein
MPVKVYKISKGFYKKPYQYRKNVHEMHCQRTEVTHATQNNGNSPLKTQVYCESTNFTEAKGMEKRFHTYHKRYHHSATLLALIN